MASFLPITKILVVDQQPVVCLGLRRLLDSQADLTVAGEAGSCQELYERVGAAQPHLVVLDPELQDLCGAEMLGNVRQQHPELPILVFTAHSDDWRVIEAVRAGVQGYITKSAMPEMILEAVRVVAAGGSYLDPKVASLVMGHVGRVHTRRQHNRRHLTARERAVLGLLVQGKRNKEISEALFVSERTVKFHLTALLQKLHAANRTEAVRKAIRQGLVTV